jgi:hypothetical protein
MRFLEMLLRVISFGVYDAARRRECAAEQKARAMAKDLEERTDALNEAAKAND